MRSPPEGRPPPRPLSKAEKKDVDWARLEFAALNEGGFIRRTDISTKFEFTPSNSHYLLNNRRVAGIHDWFLMFDRDVDGKVSWMDILDRIKELHKTGRPVREVPTLTIAGGAHDEL